MKHRILNNILLLFAVISGFFLTAAKPSETAIEQSLASEPLGLPLENIIDGSTFVSGGITVRIWGIASPPKKHFYYFAAKFYLETILKSAPFECHYIKKTEEKIMVMRCVSQGIDIASNLLRTGVAWTNEDATALYLADQEYAKTHNFGMWSANK